MATEHELSDFLKSVEKRAFKRSIYHVRDEEAALDIVQDSMMKLAQHYVPGDDGDFDLLETLESQTNSEGTESAQDATERAQILHAIEAQIQELPDRQREAFLLRYWEEMDVAETAAAMGCSEGSVKTHCSRAVHALSKALSAKGIKL